MKKIPIYLFSALSFIVLVLGPAPEVAAKGKYEGAGKSSIAHLYLYEKYPAGQWPIVEGGAWGKMRYNQEGATFDFVFNGHGLEPGTEYTLIYYPDPWPGKGLICLGRGAADAGGNVHIAGSPDLDSDLPAFYDNNHPAGAKIWLALSQDVDCTGRNMTGWHPAEYLFEHNLITYDDTDYAPDFSGTYCMNVQDAGRLDLVIIQTGESVTFSLFEIFRILIEGTGTVSGGTMTLRGMMPDTGEVIIVITFAADKSFIGTYEIIGDEPAQGSLAGQWGSCGCGAGAENPPGDISMITPYVNESDMAFVLGIFSSTESSPLGRVHSGLDFTPYYREGEANLVPFQAVSSGVVAGVNLFWNELNGFWQVNVRIIYNSAYTVEYAFEPFSGSEADGQAQLANIFVTPCQTVSQGDIIGRLYMADPNAPGHVHFSVSKNAEAVCPEPYFTPEARASIMRLIHRQNPTWEMCY